MITDLSTKISIIGYGQLGSFVYDKLTTSNKIYKLNNIKVYSRSFGNDITDVNELSNIVQHSDIIINCAAYTNVNKAENEEELCTEINYKSVKNLTDLCIRYNVTLIHISSDYVYGSFNNGVLLKETCECKPCNVYGKTKLMADEYIINSKLKKYLILRPSWVFGPHKNNFINTIIDKILYNETLKIVSDEFGIITSTSLIYNVINEFLKGNIAYGLYNISLNEDVLSPKPSRYDIGIQTLNCLKSRSSSTITPIKQSDLMCSTKRQSNSLLDCSQIDEQLQLTNVKRISWITELSKYISTFYGNLIM